MSLKEDLVKLAYNNPELRDDLLPLLKESVREKKSYGTEDKLLEAHKKLKALVSRIEDGKVPRAMSDQDKREAEDLADEALMNINYLRRMWP